jgi:hypothetical protein
MKTVRETKPWEAYYGATARVVKARDGTYRTVGNGYAGRVRYRTVERAERAVETNAQFTGWAA